MSTPKPERPAASDDEESGGDPDVPPPRPPGRPRKHATADAQELPMIPHATLVRMLAADRANNAVGDAGGYVARAVREPSLVGRADTKRELCIVHGWVGRAAFEREHESCVLEGQPCRRCRGARELASAACKLCSGTGVEPLGTYLDPLDSLDEDQVGEVPSADDSVPTGPKIRRHRRRTRPRSTSIAMKRLTREELRVGTLMYPPVDIPRPTTRAECKEEMRPCPWVACKHHLYLDINPETGSIKINFPDLEPWELKHTCALDVAERGGITLEEVGEIMNLTRERIRQVEIAGLLKLKRSATPGGELRAVPLTEDVS